MSDHGNSGDNEDILAIHDEGTLNLFVSIEREIRTKNFQLSQLQNKRLNWSLLILSAALFLLYAFIGYDTVRLYPWTFIIALFIFLLCLILSYKYRDLRLGITFIGQREYTNYPLIQFALNEELKEHGKISLKRGQSHLVSLKNKSKEMLLDWKLFLFTDGLYFPEPYYTRYDEDRLALIRMQFTASVIREILYFLSFFQFIILFYIFINNEFPNFPYWIVVMVFILLYSLSIPRLIRIIRAR